MTKRFTGIALAGVLVVSPIAMGDELMSELDGANQAFAQAVLDKNIDFLVSSYTEDACVLAPGAPRLCGLEAIRQFWTDVASSNPQDVKIGTLAVGSVRELAYATGELHLTAADGGVSAFNYVLVLKNVEGAWKLHLDTWTPQGN